MKLKFQKYQAHGNDFIMVDNLKGHYNAFKTDLSNISKICSRNFGVGSDGIIFINHHKDFPFEMEFFNPDGSKSFCGNGARCAVSFANQLDLELDSSIFYAIDGSHEYFLLGESVRIQMNNVDQIEELSEDVFILNTGSPHYVHFSDLLFDQDDFISFSKKIRFSEDFIEDGINVNLVKFSTTLSIKMRTYERGVENETLSCGTGVTAAALSFGFRQSLFGSQKIEVETMGGLLTVEFHQNQKGFFQNIWLTGNAKFVYEGSFKL